MKRIFVLIILSMFLVSLSGCSVSSRKKICFKDTCILAEIADSGAERARGLMFRKSLAQDAGMLFVFAQDKQCAMWMKNTFIPLDMLWIDRDKKIMEIKKNVLPCKSSPCPVYESDVYARYVLEVNAGFVDKHGIKIGDSIQASLP